MLHQRRRIRRTNTIHPMRLLLTCLAAVYLAGSGAPVFAGEYYGFWHRDQLLKINGWIDEDVDLDLLYIDLYEDPRWIDRLLEQFPEADTEGTGRITAEQAVRWHAKRVPLITPGPDLLKWLPEGVSHWMELVTKEDGAELGTQVYLPPGEGPFPVLVGRGIRKGGQMDLAHWYLAKGFAVVSQDLVPAGDALERGDHGGRAQRRRDPTSDTYTLIEWVSRQAWCDGAIALFGYSAGGMATLPVLERRPPKLTAIVTHIASTDPLGVFRSRGGVATRRSYDPQNRGGWDPGTPPLPDRPTLTPVTADEAVGIYKTDMAGWYDIFQQGSIDDWLAWRETGRAVLVMGAGSHGPWPRPSRVPPDYSDSDIFWPDVPQFNLLTGGIDPDSVSSVMLYFKMGDFTDPEAPGNQWMITDSWPPPSQETSFYLTADGGLDRSKPSTAGLTRSYDYDPNDPVVRVDIGWRGQIADGPVDQRPLRSRDDVIYFTTESLAEALEVTGRMTAELFISSDVPDTTFIVKLLDIYPDGYEALIAWGPMMARYHRGFDQPEKLEEGQVYRLEIDLWSTSMVFNAGHRIGIAVTSSEAGRFAVHPNTWDPIESYDEAVVARNTLHLCSDHPSRILLPVTELGAGTVYDPARHTIARKTHPWDK
ncbi:MAG: CocE/NonD family hydrolase [Puniceicoccaceae bacterium]|nr:MAG: CocE/NonD family hydrolase [Puniceicoccaceae bacterium]